MTQSGDCPLIVIHTLKNSQKSVKNAIFFSVVTFTCVRQYGKKCNSGGYISSDLYRDNVSGPGEMNATGCTDCLYSA